MIILQRLWMFPGWASANGETDPDLLDFPSYTENYLRTVLTNQISRQLEDVPKELKEVMVDFYTDLYKGYYAGVPNSYSEKKNEFGYGLWVRYMDPSTRVPPARRNDARYDLSE